MSEQELREKVREIVAEVAELDEVPDDEPFAELGIDSMIAIEIISDIERNYGVKVAEEELKQVTDLNSVVALVQSKLTSE